VSAAVPLGPDWVLYELFVPGRPAPQGSKKHVGGGIMVESSKAVGAWRELVAFSVAQSWIAPPLAGPVRLRLGFVMPRPAATPKRRTPPAIKRPDLDKLARSIFDSVTGICWRDDSQVVDLIATKRLAERDEIPGVRIQIGQVA
jgi:crossover junction endodeoxyribonuclease RusA